MVGAPPPKSYEQVVQNQTVQSTANGNLAHTRKKKEVSHYRRGKLHGITTEWLENGRK